MQKKFQLYGCPQGNKSESKSTTLMIAGQRDGSVRILTIGLIPYGNAVHT